MLFNACCVLFGVLTVVRCLPPVALCVPFGVCCVLSVVWWLLRGVCCWCCVFVLCCFCSLIGCLVCVVWCVLVGVCCVPFVVC